MTVRVFAPAKINLTLHVTGQRADGFHLLDSLVVFADVGDQVTVSRGRGLTLEVHGREAAGVPAGGENSISQAARFMGCDDLAFSLVKNLPTAAGIGGGTADAAAALRGIARLCGVKVPDDLASLGADVPVCMRAGATRMSGIGEVLSALPDLPKLNAVLVNPRISVPTPVVFKALECKDNAAMPTRIPAFGSVDDLADWLGEQRNDLEAAAISLQPEITDVLLQISQTTGCLLARMSGSGATCFGLFKTADAANAAAGVISAARPDWWIKAAIFS
ncbi:4-(cytidine 5'-diphospho)-2-C-methyl-D-erythritol kinase [Profundibacter sp.]